MQLALTVLGNTHSAIIAEILPLISDCSCNIIELRYTHLSKSHAAYFLIEGNWNQIAKLENLLENSEKKLHCKFQSLRQETLVNFDSYMPYSLEAISSDHSDLVRSISDFLLERQIVITEANGSQYQTSYVQTAVFSLKYTLLIPSDLRLLTLREEFLDFCDQLNIDAILEPIKR